MLLKEVHRVVNPIDSSIKNQVPTLNSNSSSSSSNMCARPVPVDRVKLSIDRYPFGTKRRAATRWPPVARRVAASGRATGSHRSRIQPIFLTTAKAASVAAVAILVNSSTISKPIRLHLSAVIQHVLSIKSQPNSYVDIYIYTYSERTRERELILPIFC